MMQWLLILAALLISSAHASLFGPDTLGPVRNAIKATERDRQEVQAWFHGNVSAQRNFSVTPDPTALQPLLLPRPTRSLVESDGSYYHNITGFYKGDWTGWDVSTALNRSIAIDSHLNATAADASIPKQPPTYLPGINGTELVQDRGGFNWLPKKTPARINFQLREEYILLGNVSLVKGNLGIESAPGSSAGSPDTVDFTLEGLHYLPTGALFLLGAGDDATRGNDIRDVLSMMPLKDAESRNMTARAIDEAFTARLNMLQDIIASGSWDGAQDTNQPPTPPSHNCTLHLYAQFESAGAGLQRAVNELEHEIELPTGIRTISPPPLTLQLTGYSPNCHFIIAAPQIEGLLETKLWKKAVRYAIIYLIIMIIQTRLLVQQMEVTRTPSGLNKVSYQTFIFQCILDAYGCLGHLSIAVALENETTMPLIACAFMSAICFLAFGYRYTLTIFRNQMDSMPTPAAPPTDAAPNTPVPAGEIAPVPETTDAAAPARVVEARRRGGGIFVVGAFLFMSAFFPLVMAALMLPVLYSFWIPQIFRNTQRGTRRAVQTRCVIGTTLCRLFIPLYIFACPDNVLFFDPNPWIYALAIYLVLQAIVLLGQDAFGAHFFLPTMWIPASAMTAWDWHPPVKSTDVAQDPETNNVESLGDCAICLNAIEPSERDAVRRRRKPRRDGYEAPSEQEDEDRRAPAFPPEKGLAGQTPSPPQSGPRRSRNVSTWRTWLAKAIRHGLRWRKELGAASNLRRKRSEIMIAPCHHVFHTHCLERWLTIKTECPSCRSPLPPV